MANPIAFEPKRVDPRKELERRLAAAPTEHAEALLVAFDVLEEAHRQGLLDMLHGAIGSRDGILGKVAEYAKEPVSTQALRNLMILGKLLGSLDPEILSGVAKRAAAGVEAAHGESETEQEPPTLWELFKRIKSKEGRRGLGVATAMLTGLGGKKGS